MWKCLSTTSQPSPSYPSPGHATSPGVRDLKTILKWIYLFCSLLPFAGVLSLASKRPPILMLMCQVRVAGSADARLWRHFPGAGQDAALRQARHRLRRHLRPLPLRVDRHQARGLSNMDILQVTIIGQLGRFSFNQTKFVL